jgi:hypothetical protein
MSGGVFLSLMVNFFNLLFGPFHGQWCLTIREKEYVGGRILLLDGQPTSIFRLDHFMVRLYDRQGERVCRGAYPSP